MRSKSTSPEYSPNDILAETQKVLTTIQRNNLVGSDNIRGLSHNIGSLSLFAQTKPISKLVEVHRTNSERADSVRVAPELQVAKKDRQRTLEALLDTKVSEHAFRTVSNLRKIREPYQNASNPYFAGLFYFLAIKLTHEFGAGNCFDMSLQSMQELHKTSPEISMKLVCFQNYDHVFVVLNLPPDADIKDRRTWGNAIIMDPWLNTSYPANEFLEFWQKNLSFLNLQNNAKISKAKDSTAAKDTKDTTDSTDSTDSTAAKDTTDSTNAKDAPPIKDFLAIEEIIKGEYLFLLMQPYQHLFANPKWQNELINLLPGPDAKVFLLNYAQFREFPRNAIKNPTLHSVCKVFEVCSVDEANYLRKNVWQDLYQKEYRAQTATPEQMILYLMTTSDITLIDTSRMRMALLDYNVVIAPFFRQKLLTLCAVVDILKQNTTSNAEKNKYIFEWIINFNSTTPLINLQGLTNLNNLKLENAVVNWSGFPHSNLSRAELTDCKFNGSCITSVNFSEAKLTRCSFNAIKQNDGHDAVTELSNADFRGAQLVSCNFQKADLRNAIFIDASFTDTNFTNANLTNTRFIPKKAFADQQLLDQYLTDLSTKISSHNNADILSMAIVRDIIYNVEVLLSTNRGPQLQTLSQEKHYLSKLQTALDLVEQATQHQIFQRQEPDIDNSSRPTDKAYKELLSYQEKLEKLIENNSEYRPRAAG